MDELLMQALSTYGLAGASSQFLQGLWNQLYFVETKEGSRFALRICAAAYKDKQSLSDEMAWLAYIARHYPALAPCPIPNKYGEVVTALSTPESERFSCLFAWIDGEIAETRLSAPVMHEIGRTVAILHQLSRAFAFPSSENTFRRNYCYDRELAGAHLEWIEVHQTEIGAVNVLLLRRAIAWLLEGLDQIGKTQQYYGFIHADLHLGNFLVHEGAVHVIDFDQLGRGHYLYDIATLLIELQGSSEHFPAYWASFKRGYQTVAELPFHTDSELELFIVAVRLAFLDWVYNSSEPLVRETKLPLASANIESIRKIIGSTGEQRAPGI